MSKANMPAFPNPLGSQAAQEVGSGLSKREYFALHLAAGYAANAHVWGDLSMKDIPALAVKHADTLLEELERENQK